MKITAFPNGDARLCSKIIHDSRFAISFSDSRTVETLQSSKSNADAQGPFISTAKRFSIATTGEMVAASNWNGATLQWSSASCGRSADVEIIGVLVSRNLTYDASGFIEELADKIAARPLKSGWRRVI